MGAPRIRSPRLVLVREGFDDLEVQTANPDFLVWDLTRAKHRWPSLQEAPFLGMTFLGWAGARRLGAIPPDLTWETFQGQVLDLQVVKDPDAPDGVVPPFPEAPGGD